jgi:putative oxidoreductase
MVAWGEVLAGLGIILGGLIAGTIGSLITRISGGAIGVIMIGAIGIAHSNWGIFFGERGSVLFASEQLFLLLLGIYFAIKGNQK